MANFGNDISKFKMVIYLKDRSRLIFYSLVNEDKKSDEYSIKGMVRRLLERRFRNKYHTAIVYNRETDSEICKYIDGRKV